MNGIAINDNIIGDSEPITRILFYPSMVDNGSVSPSAFELEDLEHGPEKYVSLYLLNIFQPTKENCVRLRARKEGDKLYGYATSIINKCAGITFDGISICFKKHDKNTAGHIGLHYSKGDKAIKGKCFDPSFLIVTKMIALQFVAFQFPA